MENYKPVIRLTPLGCEGEATEDKAEANHHIPRADAWHWVAGGGDIEDDDPNKAGEKGPDHNGCQPTRAFFGRLHRLHNVGRCGLLRFFTELGFRHRRG